MWSSKLEHVEIVSSTRLSDVTSEEIFVVRLMWPWHPYPYLSPVTKQFIWGCRSGTRQRILRWCMIYGNLWSGWTWAYYYEPVTSRCMRCQHCIHLTSANNTYYGPISQAPSRLGENRRERRFINQNKKGLKIGYWDCLACVYGIFHEYYFVTYTIVESHHAIKP